MKKSQINKKEILDSELDKCQLAKKAKKQGISEEKLAVEIIKKFLENKF